VKLGGSLTLAIEFLKIYSAKLSDGSAARARPHQPTCGVSRGGWRTACGAGAGRGELERAPRELHNITYEGLALIKVRSR
jgi:hypothetical protein